MSFYDREEEDRQWRHEEERRREREREHAPAYSSLEEMAQRHPILAAATDGAYEPLGWPNPTGTDEPQFIGKSEITTDPTLLMILRPKHGTEGVVVRQAMRAAEADNMTLMIWGTPDCPRPRLRIRLALRLLLGRGWRRV